MTGPDARPLPSGYPDPAIARSEEFDYLDLHIRMTVTPGERFVQLWELVDDHPARWLGNAFRVDAEPPCLYLTYRFEPHFSRLQRDALARIAAKFWKP
ncbi:MAG TPA: hypothetical protein VHG10_06455 [Glycomyces sp.]|nr:hypothetical protein [Glycomyces sp.]